MRLARFMVHTVTVETFEGVSVDGDVFAAPVTLKCFRDDQTQLVSNSTGEQVVSHTTLYGPIGDLDAYTPDSRVTLPSGPSRVIGVLARDSGGRLPDHVEVHLE